MRVLGRWYVPAAWACIACVTACGESVDSGDTSLRDVISPVVDLRPCDLGLDNPLRYWLERGRIIAMQAVVSEIGPPRTTETIYGALVLRVVSLTDSSILLDESPYGLKQLVVQVGDPSVPGPEGGTQIELEELGGRETILIAGASSEPDTPAFLTGAAILGPDGDITFPGSCSELLSAHLSALTAKMMSSGEAKSEAEVLQSWIAEIASGDDEHFRTAAAAVIATPSNATWESSSIVSRGLSPDIVPAAIAEHLDVKALFVEVDGLTEDLVIVVRTESGVGAATRVGKSDAPIPLFFVVGTDTSFTVSISPVSDNLASTKSVVASVKVGDFQQFAGLVITGDAKSLDIDLRILTIEDVALRLGANVDDIQLLREQTLAPAEAAAT